MAYSPEVTKIGNVTVYFGSGAPTDAAYVNKGDLYFRHVDAAASQAYLYVATASGGTWKAAATTAS